MSIRLSWANSNPTADSVIVYRASAAFAPSALPAPLATLAGNATSYDDTTIVRNTVMYYRIKIVKGSEELISPQLVQGHFPDSGPGPQTLLRGNWALGYFGRIPVAQMWSISQFRTATGATGIASAPADTNLVFWHKFIRNGKIIFVPGSVMSTSGASYDMLYLAGLVYGTNDNGAVPPGLTSPPAATNQQKIITLGAYNFLVRLPLGCTLPVNAIQPNFNTALEGSEWDETIGRCYMDYAQSFNSARLDDASSALRPASLTQHLTTNARFNVYRGTPSVDSATSQFNGYWVPFVELIP